VLAVRRLGENINQEANLHVSLLGEIDHDLERANGEMSNNLEYARRLHKRSGTCSLWITILCLLVILIFLLSFQ
jgi:t-SNARE complex subunit (syntaxin)